MAYYVPPEAQPKPNQPTVWPTYPQAKSPFGGPGPGSSNPSGPSGGSPPGLVTPGGEKKKLPKEVPLNLPPMGAALRESDPTLAFRHWLDGQYIPPAIKSMLMQLYGRVFEDYNVENTVLMDPKEEGGRGMNLLGIPTFGDWLKKQQYSSMLGEYQNAFPQSLLAQLQNFGGQATRTSAF